VVAGEFGDDGEAAFERKNQSGVLLFGFDLGV
jgi:hypothetical protein